MTKLKDKIVLITGASAGIGLATAAEFAAHGSTLVLGARRIEKLQEVSKTLARDYAVTTLALALDVTDEKSCESFISDAVARFGKIDILINNAGLARGTDKVADVSESDMREVFETNVFGLLRLSRFALKDMLPRNEGHIINLGSVAGYMPYEGGSVYCASKFGVRAITEALRLELLGTNIRASCISPGLVETEFSRVRFRGDDDRAKRVYQGMMPLTAKDIAECILFIASRPPHVDIDDLIVRPVAQAGLKVHRT
ncbi:MAG: short-chain dehydrogenase [[Candidatus Thermochlorobacteriaceae] bacterium GBChlB]|nr:MAG: short-chain dehydrogenase [[Candidatus Thermochlorobacteriaceae] bacterium GBChlB]